MGDLHPRASWRGRACEGEGGHGEGVRGRGNDVREGESAGERERLSLIAVALKQYDRFNRSDRFGVVQTGRTGPAQLIGKSFI